MATAEPTLCVHCPLVVTGQGDYARGYTPRLATAGVSWRAAIGRCLRDALAVLAIGVILFCSMVGAVALGTILAAWICGGQ